MRNSGGAKLVYPSYRRWRLSEGAPKEWTGQDVIHLRLAVIDDFSRLCDAHIPYDPDLATLSVVRLRGRSDRPSAYLPILDTFDFDFKPSTDDQTEAWERRKETGIKNIEDQFRVLEVSK